MPTELASAEVIHPRRRKLSLEVVLVVLISAAVFIPGIWRYSLVDPWETHYGEVAREMLQNNDYVHTQWYGTSSGSPADNEGFRSKPVLMFWLMSAGLQTMGVGDNGGYSGEMVQDARTMVGIRLPFILCAIAGLTLLWWMLARLVSRRLAWLALLVVGSTPIFSMIARNGIPDMPMVACTMGALALFTMAVEDGDRPIVPLCYLFRRRVAIDARHIVLGLAGALVIVQALYYAFYFTSSPYLGVRGRIPNPALWVPGMMVLMLAGLSRDGWLLVRLPAVLVGGVIAAIKNEPMPRRLPGQSGWRHVVDDILVPWERHALDRYLLRGLLFPFTWLVRFILAREPNRAGDAWATTGGIAEHALRMGRITRMRQVYLIGCYFLLGVSVLAKGPVGLTVVAGVGAFHVILRWRWRELYDGGFEIKRGLLMMSAVAVAWHVAMYLKEGVRFVDEYIFTHIINRAAQGVDHSPGTFEYYTSQIGHGMWVWAALLPAALAAAFLRSNQETRAGRVRFMVCLWAIVAFFLFCFVQTKFHHYILPAIPPLGLLVAFFLDDLVTRRDRMHPVYAALAVGIVLLICRDLMFEPERWIEMFVFRYDRPWPHAEPWQIDVSDGVLALGLAAALGLAITGTRFVRLGVAVTGAAGLAICIWGLQVYMPLAGQHWGMRDAARTYYEQRTIYGQKLVYFGSEQLYADWKSAGNTWTFETFVPDNLMIDQPMTLTIQVNKPTDERVTEKELALIGKVTAIGHHHVTITFAPGERAKVDPLIADGKRATERRASSSARRPRPPVKAVDADRLIAWQLYWRGENFWSGGEIWHWLPEMKTSLVATNNTEFQKYINDRTRAPLGRRYFIITEAGRISSARSMLPTQRARDTYEVIDTTSNKFSIAAFYL